MSFIPRALTPIYKTPEINQVIKLHEGLIEVTDDHNYTVLGNGKIEYQWLPEPRVWLQCQYETKKPIEKPKVQIALSPAGKRFDVTMTYMQPVLTGSKLFCTFAGLPHGLTNGVSENLQSLIFHLPNFSYFYGSLIQGSDEKPPWNGRAFLSVHEWNITIDSIDDYDPDDQTELRNSSGSAITHVGMVERQDNSAFSVSDVEQLLSTLHLYLSFYRGTWVGPILPVGFDQHREKVFQHWGQPKINKFERVQTWANYRSAESLELPFPGFYAKYRSSLWSNPIRQSIAWYVECNRRASGLEASIILIQTALELLGWAILVEDSKTISPKGFDDLPAADKIRLVLANCEIPRDIPPNLSALKQAAGRFNWSDGPECLVGMRNALVHPQLKNRKKVEKMPPLTIFEVWSMGMRYLDLILLRLFGYSGMCLNRLKREIMYDEALERVPWA